MVFLNRLSQALHEEHEATTALLRRLQGLIGQYRRRDPPDAADRGVAQLLSDLPTSLRGEVLQHFAFEEQKIFAYLEAAGHTEIVAHLTSEHETVRPLGARLAALADDAVVGGFDAPGFTEFSRRGLELCDQLLPHVGKEEMVLLPLLEETMDAQAEDRLFQDYLESRSDAP